MFIIVSSVGGAKFALHHSSPIRIDSDLLRATRTSRQIDDFEQTHLVIDSFEDVLRKTLQTDLGPFYGDLAAAPDLNLASVYPSNRIRKRDTQAHALEQEAAA